MKKSDVYKFIKQYYAVFLVIFIFGMAFYLRGIPGTKLEYPRLQAIDPYFMMRMGEHIVEYGTVPEHDYLAGWGTIPEGPDRGGEHLFTLYAYPALYFIFNPLFGVDFYWAAVWGPALFGALQVLFIYFLGKEMFNRNVGLLAAAFLAFVPGILYRVSAGFMEKEPVAGMFLIISLLLFGRGFREKGIIGFGFVSRKAQIFDCLNDFLFFHFSNYPSVY